MFRAACVCTTALAMASVAAETATAQTTHSWTALRRPAVAGSWYPGNAKDLGQAIDGYLAEAKVPKLPGRPVAVISPHAGIRFSGPVAAHSYKVLKPYAFQRVILIGFSHRYSGAFEGASIPRVRAYRTPLGDVPLDQQAARKLLDHRLFHSYPQVHRQEHSIEIQLPFLQRVLGRFRLVPISLGEVKQDDLDSLADQILALLDEKSVIVVSSDFIHYGPNYDYLPFQDHVEENLAKLDGRAADLILKTDLAGFSRYLMDTDATICGRHPIRLLLRILQKRGHVRGRRLAYDTSGRITGSFANSVSYLSIVFWDTGRKKPGSQPAADTGNPGSHQIASLQTGLSADDKRTLLRLARAEITRALGGKAERVEATISGKRATGAFVTLTNQGKLRGCIGRTGDGLVLSEAIRSAARMACRDSRFLDDPVTLAEVPKLHISITVLGPMERIHSPGDIRIGRHGLKIVRGNRQGWLLPQVASERCWNRREFFAQVCRKAGLPFDAWKQKGTEIYRFTAEVFGEEKHGA